jgi:hypothetical protein
VEKVEGLGSGGDQGEGFEAGTIGPLPRVPYTGEGKGSGFDCRDGKDTLDGLGGCRDRQSTGLY